MRKIVSLLALVVVLIARAAEAQTSLTADRIYLGATGCALRTGAGTPTGGTSCDFYYDTATGHVWANHGGTWIDISTRTPTFTSVIATTKLTTPLIDTATGPLALAPASGAIVPATNLGASFGTPTQKFLALHLGELWAESLVAQDVLATIGGRVIVAPTTMLVADLAPAATTITVKANTLQNGDRVFLQSAPAGVPQMEWLAVTSAASGSAGAYTYTVTRNIDGSGANQWLGGDAVVDTGTAGKGFIDLYALSGVLTGAGPTMVGNVRTGTAFNAYAPRFAVGNLNGLYAHSGDQYGFAAGNPAGANVYFDDTNGLVMGGPLGTRVQITPAGAATFIGDGGGVTNIDGGNIRADSITSAQIAANSITVGDLNATGYGDNVIKNGAFEPSVGEAFGAASAFAGWVKAVDATTTEALVNSPGGVLGPGTLQLRASAGTYNGAAYLAVPVERSPSGAPGVQYRISGRVFASAGGAQASLFIFIEESNEHVAGVRRVVRGSGSAPDIGRTTETVIANCAVVPSAWSTFEYVYTPPADTTWISIHIYNGTGICGGIYDDIFFDDLEMQKQIGTGHISANSITANLIAAGAITADKIAAGAITADKITAGSITGDKIAASTITGTNIAGSTITGTHIAADSITSAHIVSGTITASDIATGTITADRLNVTALSAITANLGSVTAGSLSAVAITGGTIDGTTIRGVSISASSTLSGGTITGTNITGSTLVAGSVTLDGNGMTVANGDGGGSARIKLGSIQLWGSNSTAALVSDGNFDIQAIRAHQAVDFEKTAHVYQNATIDGTLSVGSVAGDLRVSGWVIPQNVVIQVNNGTMHWQNAALPPVGSGGNFVLDSNCICLTRQSSSQRYKDNLRGWAPPDPLAILSMPLYRYDLRDAPGIMPAKNRVGLLAEDLARVAPEAVVRDAQGRPDTFYGDTLDAYLLAALKAVNARVSRLDGLTARSSQVAALEQRIRALETKVAALEAAAKKKD